MELSSTFCRVQETYQRDRATSAALENVHAIADKAAKAWGMMALGAERREARRERTRIIANMAALEDERSSDEEDQFFNENPDRGCANP